MNIFAKSAVYGTTVSEWSFFGGGGDLWLYYDAVSYLKTIHMARIWKIQSWPIEVLSRHLPGGTEGSHEKPVGTVGCPAETRTEHPPHPQIQVRVYRYTNLLVCSNGKSMSSNQVMRKCNLATLNGPIRHVETCPDFFFHYKSTHNKIHCQNFSC
jgi:hypothetical protein